MTEERASRMMRRISVVPTVPLEDLNPADFPPTPTSDAAERYHEEARWRCGLHRWRSMADVSVDPVVQAKLAKARSAGARRNILRAHGYSAPHWSPILAAAFYRSLGARRVLDPCAGWGDRLAAALACLEVEVYHGWDPNTRTAPGYAQQIEDWGAGRDFRVTCGSFEDAVLPDGFYDVALTSPPYWKLEHYSLDPGQSYLRYPTLDAWVAGFLRPMFANVARALRPGGHFVLNIANVMIAGGLAPLADISRQVATEHPFDLVTTKGLPIGARSVFVKEEPIFIWSRHGR